MRQGTEEGGEIGKDVKRKINIGDKVTEGHKRRTRKRILRMIRRKRRVSVCVCV